MRLIWRGHAATIREADMKITPEELDTLAKLAKLELSGDERKALQKDLSAILDFVEQLNELDTRDVPPTSQVTGLQNVVRSDEVNYDFAKEDMLATMPETDDAGHLRVHAVFKDGSPSN